MKFSPLTLARIKRVMKLPVGKDMRKQPFLCTDGVTLVSPSLGIVCYTAGLLTIAN